MIWDHQRFFTFFNLHYPDQLLQCFICTENAYLRIWAIYTFQCNNVLKWIVSETAFFSLHINYNLDSGQQVAKHLPPK